MVKGIIVVDMPERCDDCPVEAYNETFYGDELNHLCPFEYKGYTDDVRGNRRADWCPIQHMPEKRNEHDACYDSDFYRAEGWNACIDEILKGDIPMP